MKFSLLPSLTAALLIAAAAQAQTPPDAPPPGEMTGERHADMCRDRLARAHGHLASLEIHLHLTPAQKPLFAKWKSVKLETAQDMLKTCLADQPPPPDDQAKAPPPAPDPVEMMKREQRRLQQRLQALKAEMPAFEALVASLSDSQKRALHPPGHRGGIGPHGGKHPMGGHGGDAPPPAP